MSSRVLLVCGPRASALEPTLRARGLRVVSCGLGDIARKTARGGETREGERSNRASEVLLLDLDPVGALDVARAWLTLSGSGPLVGLASEDTLSLSKAHSVAALGPAAVFGAREPHARIVERAIVLYTELAHAEPEEAHAGAAAEGVVSNTITADLESAERGTRGSKPPLGRESRPDIVSSIPPPTQVRRAISIVPPHPPLPNLDAEDSERPQPRMPSQPAAAAEESAGARDSLSPPDFVDADGREGGVSSAFPRPSVSPALEALLGAAEVRAARPQFAEPTTSNERFEPRGLIPDDILAALNMPLDRELASDDDEDDIIAPTGIGQRRGALEALVEPPQSAIEPRAEDHSTGEVRAGENTTGAHALTGEVRGAKPPHTLDAPLSRAEREATTPRPPRASARAVASEGIERKALSKTDSAPVESASAQREAAAATERKPRTNARATSRLSERAPAPPSRAQAALARGPNDSASRGVVLAGDGAILRLIGGWIADRRSGIFELAATEGRRQLVLSGGDFVTCASLVPGEDLVSFLADRGDLSRRESERLRGRTPGYGRLAAAALIAGGVLASETMWDVLRAHAEHLLTLALRVHTGTLSLATEPFSKLEDEPNVFGGATGASIFVEATRRSIDGATAMARLGGSRARLLAPKETPLFLEAGLPEHERLLLERGLGLTLAELAQRDPSVDIAELVYPLVLLGASGIAEPTEAHADKVQNAHDPLDDEAKRTRIRARAALVDEGDYFAVLGVAREATAYDIRRAYLELRREFEPSRMLSPQIADLRDDVVRVLDVVTEAYEILRDSNRRERYRKAISATPGS